MEIITNILAILGILALGFCGVFAPFLLPLFVRDEFKGKFKNYMDAMQPPYCYQSKWFTPKGVLLQRLALLVWVPAIIYAVYFLLVGGLSGIHLQL